MSPARCIFRQPFNYITYTAALASAAEEVLTQKRPSHLYIFIFTSAEHAPLTNWDDQDRSVHGRTYVVDVLWRLPRLGLRRRRGAAMREQHRACVALHIVRRKECLRIPCDRGVTPPYLRQGLNHVECTS